MPDPSSNPLADDLRRYQAYFESTTSGLFIYGPDGDLVDINPAACRMHGYTRAEMLSMDPREFIAPESHGVFAAFREAVMAGETFSGEARGLRRDGSPFDVEVEGRLIEIGGRHYLFSSLIDVTERNSLQEQLRHAQRMEAIGQLAGGVAHDFNNLLTVILGYSELLSVRLGDPELREGVQTILDAGERARDLVQRLLAFSRRQTLMVETTDLRRFVDDQVNTLRRVLPASIDIAVHASEDEILVRIDRGQLEQVLLNLAINAQQAMDGRGHLTLEIEHVQLDREFAKRHNEVSHGPHALLSVTDTGTGMDARTLARIFEPFFTTKPKGTGTGLGLAMVYGIVKQHGGHISVYSEPGHGTTFKLYLPLQGERAEEQARPRAELPPGGTERVLVVEDDEAVRALTVRMLEDLGYEVLTADGLDQALGVSQGLEGLDLLLTDVVLRGANGRAVHRDLVERFPKVRVLYMSGYTQNVISHQGVLDEGVRLITKPFSFQTLAQTVREVLDEGST